MADSVFSIALCDDKCFGLMRSLKSDVLQEFLWTAPDDTTLQNPVSLDVFLPPDLLADGQQLQALLVSAYDGRSVLAGGESGLESAMRYLFAAAGPGGILAEELLLRDVPSSLLRLQKIQRITQAPVAEISGAFILHMASIPNIAARSFREGVTLLYADGSFVYAALLFQGRIFGMVMLPFVGWSDISPLLKDLESFRLGWLPPEKARNAGGFCVSYVELPPEAEGFKPLFIGGPATQSLSGHGQLVAQADNASQGAHGLLFGYALQQENERL